MAVTKTAQFNNGFAQSGGITLSFARDVATRDPAGNTIAVNSPRYGPNQLVAAASMGATTVLSIAGQGQVLGTGYDADGITKVWVVYNQLNASFQIRRGTFATIAGQMDISVANSTRTGSHETAMATAGITADFFSQNNIALAPPTGYVDESWMPKSAVVCHGVIVVYCHVGHIANGDDHTVAGNWKKQKIGIATALVSAVVSNVNTAFVRHAISDAVTAETNAALTIGQTWSLSTYWCRQRTGTAPTEAWIALADYQAHPYAFGAIFGVMRMTRPITSSGTWTCGDMVEMPITTSSRLTRATSIMHAHACGVCGFGANGIHVIGSLGDGPGNNAILLWTCTDASTYETGTTDAGTNWRKETSSGSSGFGVGPGPGSGDGIINGYIDTNGTIAAGEYDDVRLANQFVGIAAGPAECTFLLGSDEMDDTILLADLSSMTVSSKLTMTAIYTPQRTKVVPQNGSPAAGSRRFCSFQLRPEFPERLAGPCVGMMHAGTGENEQEFNTRLLYSPDSSNWTMVFSPNEPGGASAHLIGGEIYWGCGSTFGNIGIRKIPVPAYDFARPLLVGPGGVNRLNASVTITNRAVGESIQTKVTAPTGCPALGECVHIMHTGASDPDVCTIELGDIPQATEQIKIVLWLRNADVADWGATNPPFGSSLAPASAAASMTFQLSAANKTSGGATSSGFVANAQYHSMHAGWTRVELTSHFLGWRPASNFAGVEVQTLSLLIQCHTGTQAPLDCYLALDGVYAMLSTTGEMQGSYPLSPATTGGNELVALGGLNLVAANDWIVYFHGKSRFDNSHPMSFNGTFTTAATATTLTGGSAVDDFYNLHRLFITDATFANNETRGVEITDYVGATKGSTHEATALTGAGKVCQIYAPRIDHCYGTPERTLLPLFSLSNAAGTRGVTVFADTVKSAGLVGGLAFQLCAMRYVSGGFATTNDYDVANAIYLESCGGGNGTGEIYFLPDGELNIALSYDTTNGAGLILQGSVGNAAMDPTGIIVDFMANDFSGDGPLTQFLLGGLGTPTGETSRRVAPLAVFAVRAVESPAAGTDIGAGLVGLDAVTELLGGGGIDPVWAAMVRRGQLLRRRRRHTDAMAEEETAGI